VNDARAILLWSVGLSLLAIVAAGYYFTNSVYSVMNSGDSGVYSIIGAELLRLEQSGGGSSHRVGVSMDRGEYLSAKSFISAYRDYREAELDPRYAVRPDGIRFDCSDSRLDCGSDYVSVSYDYTGPAVRLDIDTDCIPIEKTLSCVIRLSPSTSERFVHVDAPGSTDPVQKEMTAWLLDFNRTKLSSGPGNPVLDAYDGRAIQSLSDVILAVAQIGILLHALEPTHEERLDLAANRQYGIPFVDGTADLESHTRMMRSKIHVPEPLGRISNPRLDELITESLESFENPIRPDFFAPSTFASSVRPSFPLSESEFYRSTSAYLFVSETLPVARLNGYLAILQSSGESAATVIYPHLSEGTLDEQAQRLRAVYELENGGLSVAEKEQRLANAVLWLESHPDLDSVALKEMLKPGQIIRTNRVSEKAGGLPILFDASNPDFGNFAVVVDAGNVEVEQSRVFYWIVRKDALNNGYTVIVSRTSKLEDDAA